LKCSSNSSIYSLSGNSSTSYNNVSTLTNEMGLQAQPFEFGCFFFLLGSM
jgi:hypothetical protein